MGGPDLYPECCALAGIGPEEAEMLTLLPLIGFVFLFKFFMLAPSRVKFDIDDWRDAFAAATLVWGLLVFGFSEILGAFGALTRMGVIVAWCIVLLISLIFFRRHLPWSFSVKESWCNTIARLRNLERAERFILAGLLLIILITGIVALVSPPQIGDALAYHMSRVVHWAQNRSVSHYATPDSRHLWMPPWTEYTVMHLYLLWGGDQLVNLVQWFSVLATIVVVSRVADMLGSNRLGQFIAAIFSATIPFGILQATDGLTDYVVTYWVICTAWIVLRGVRGLSDRSNWILLGLNVGLGLLTKGTYAVYVLPMLLWFAWATWRRLNLALWISRNLGMAALAIVLALPMWMRNWVSFGSPIGPLEHTEGVTNRIYDLQSLISNLIRNLSLHLASPYDNLNTWIAKGVTRLHELAHLDVSEPALTGYRYDLDWLWPGTNTGLLHFGLILITIGLLALELGRKKNQWKKDVSLALCAVSGFTLYCLIFKFQGDARFHIPFFILFAPVVAHQLSARLHRSLIVVAVLSLFVVAAPPVLADRWHPLIGFRPYTVNHSILTVPRRTLYFRAMEEKRPVYEATADIIHSTQCDQVGLRINSNNREYLWWVVLEPQQHNIRLEHLLIYPGLELYRDESFIPCAVVCSVCYLDDGQMYGLWPHDQGTGIILYLPE